LRQNVSVIARRFLAKQSPHIDADGHPRLGLYNRGHFIQKSIKACQNLWFSI
jgi:hypothetical protein